MGVDHPGQGAAADLKRVQRNQGVATLQNAAIGRAGLRVYDGGWVRIENGGLSVTGEAIVSGELTGSGTLDWTGTSFLRGPVNVSGNSIFSGTLNVSGNSAFGGTLYIGGETTLATTLNVLGGLIQAGAVRITPTNGGMIQLGSVQIDGEFGGTIRSSGTLYLTGGNTTAVRVSGLLSVSDLLVLGKITAGELDVVGPKNFRMEHPTKPGYWLRHGSTESPVSGTEYTGRIKLDAAGEAVVELPPYFEALNKPGNRTVQLTPVGRPFPVGADEVVDGKVTVYGAAGREVFWLVKAERKGADFKLEEKVPATEDGEGQA